MPVESKQTLDTLSDISFICRPLTIRPTRDGRIDFRRDGELYSVLEGQVCAKDELLEEARSSPGLTGGRKRCSTCGHAVYMSKS